VACLTMFAVMVVGLLLERESLLGSNELARRNRVIKRRNARWKRSSRNRKKL